MFIYAIAVKEDSISVKYLGTDGPVTRHAIQPSVMFAGAWDRLREAIVCSSGVDLSFWTVDAFKLTALKVNLTKFSKELLEEEGAIDQDAEYESVEVNFAAEGSQDAPSFSTTVKFFASTVEANRSLRDAFEAVSNEAIASLKEPVRREVIQLRLELSTPAPNNVAQLIPGNIDVDAYEYDPQDLLGKDGTELTGGALSARKASLVRKGKAQKKAS